MQGKIFSKELLFYPTHGNIQIILEQQGRSDGDWVASLEKTELPVEALFRRHGRGGGRVGERKGTWQGNTILP